MPVRRRSFARVIHALTGDQMMSLVIGRGRNDPFVDDDERRAAWLAHRDEVMAFGNYRPGHRPAAWWAYEAPEEIAARWWGIVDLDEYYAAESEVDQLRRLGLLTLEEIAELDARAEVSHAG